MSGDLFGFNANNVKPNEPRGPIPKGEYPMVFVEKEKVENSKKTGYYLSLKAQVLSGEFQNRTVYAMLNLWNPSAEAVKISQGELSSICRATGVMTPDDSSELLNKPFIGVLKVDGEYNKFTDYKPRSAGPSQPLPMTQPQSPSGQPQSGVASANPWGTAQA